MGREKFSISLSARVTGENKAIVRELPVRTLPSLAITLKVIQFEYLLFITVLIFDRICQDIGNFD